ncbi:hypothetical protein M405DRAFT_868893 [Rhizopogon salebrosus TDB-379]|nr:hypothetical protein M405DRAFT_868893 [Rhizopogon salebrosus TDB-379]
MVDEWRVLIEIKLGEFVRPSKDCAHLFMFSASFDSTTLEMVYQYRHIPLPYEGDLAIASLDSSVRIWERKTNQPAGDIFLRDDILLLLSCPAIEHVSSVPTWARNLLYGALMGWTCNAQSGGNARRSSRLPFHHRSDSTRLAQFNLETSLTSPISKQQANRLL